MNCLLESRGRAKPSSYGSNSVVQSSSMVLSREQEKKLDLNAPLISVRKNLQNLCIESTGSSSEDEHSRMQEAEQVPGWGSTRSPGAVPFVWERTPGRPKLECPSPSFYGSPSPSLPPGRTVRADPVDRRLGKQHEQFRRNSKQQTSLGELFKRRAPPSEEYVDPHEDDSFEVFSMSRCRPQVSCEFKVNNNASSSSSSSWNDPGARDFILQRFLPAAKAMADESASSSPFSSPLVPHHNGQLTYRGIHSDALNHRITTRSPSSSSPRKQVSASVERIQAFQYKFAGGGGGISHKKGRNIRHDEDFFTLKACGFFSLSFTSAFKHLRSNYPSSRLKRSSDRNNNRFASDEFRTSVLVKKVNGNLTIKHEDSETETEDGRKPRWSKMKSPNKNSQNDLESFYDCDTDFEQPSPRKRNHEPYTCTSASPRNLKSNGSHGDKSNGFLGFPENYKPPEHTYTNGVYSPSERRNTRSENTYNYGVYSPSLYDRSPAVDAGQRWSTTNNLPRNAVDLQSPARSNGALLPPKSPSQPWLWKALPVPQEKNIKWEATVKSRQLRPDHLRYSEENALQY